MPEAVVENINPNDVISANRTILQETKQWQGLMRHSSSALVSPAAAVGALGELTPGGALMRGFQEQSLARRFFNLKLIGATLQPLLLQN